MINPKRTLALYAMASRDFFDFLDALKEEDNALVLELLQSILVAESNSPNHDQELNDLMLPFVNKRVEELKND